MGLLVKQPNGKFAVFSTIAEEFMIWNATKEQIVEWAVEREMAEVRERAERWVTGKYPGRAIHDLEKVLEKDALNRSPEDIEKMRAELSKEVPNGGT